MTRHLFEIGSIAILLFVGSPGLADVQQCMAPPLLFPHSSFVPSDAGLQTIGRGGTVGDLNEDGIPDLVNVHQIVNNHPADEFLYSVLFGQGDGTFGDEVKNVLRPTPVPGYPTMYPDDYFPMAIWSRVVDADGDGHADILALDTARDFSSPTYNAIWLVRGHGDGTFEPTQYALLPTDSHGEVVDIAVGDLNGDDRPDLALALVGPVIAVTLNNGDGTFGPLMSVPVVFNSRGLDVGDVDGDGDLDIAVTVSGGFPIPTNKVSVLFNDGTGAFPVRADWVTPQDFPKRILLTHLNADNLPDFVIEYDNQGWFSSSLNDGTGMPGITTTHQHGVSAGSFNDTSEYLGAGDVDGDGDNDVVIHRYNRQVAIYSNDGNGSLTFTAAYEADLVSPRIFVVDANGDGQNDLVTEGAMVLINRGGGVFESYRRFPVGTDEEGVPGGLSVGDLDHDGDPDICGRVDSLDGPWTIFVLRNAGGASFSQTWTTTPATRPMWTALADVDRDGHLDLIVTAFGNSIYIYSGNGDATFDTPPATYAGLVNVPRALTVADVTDDEWPDLIVAGRVAPTNPTSPAVWVAPNQGDGTFSTATAYASPENSHIGFGGGPAVGDLNGDDVPDIAFAHWFDPAIQGVRLNQGDGSFGSETLYTPADYPSQSVMADLDGDGDLDVATCNGWTLSSQPGSISVFINPGNGALAPPVNYHVNPPTSDTQANDLVSMVAGDFDGDGDVDLVASNDGHLNIYIFTNRGDATFDEVAIPYAIGGNTSLVIGDFDGNGLPDLATASRRRMNELNGHVGSVNVLLNRACGGGGRPGDLDGDGDVDLLDLPPFIDCLLGTAPPPDHQDSADLNNDGTVDGLDIQSFVNALCIGG